MKSMRAPFTMPSPGVRVRTMQQLLRLLRVRERATRTMTPRRLPLASRLLRIRKVLMPASTGSFFFRTGASEVFDRELRNLFGTTSANQKRDIVDLAPGSGPLAWTACRESFLYTGVVGSETHATLIQASLRLNIVKERSLAELGG